MSNILLVTPILKEPVLGENGRPVTGGTARLYGRAFATIYRQRWAAGRVDHFCPSGDDDYRFPNETVTRKFELARQVFLAGDYDYFASLEYDMIVPEDAIERLVEVDADIAYGLYVFRHTGRHYWNAAKRMEIGGAAWLSNSPDEARAAFGSVIDVEGCGLGCTLIRRHALEKLRFRNWRGVSCDWALACDAREAEFTQKLDTRVVCGHQTIVPSPQIFWPDVEAEKLYRQEFLS